MRELNKNMAITDIQIHMVTVQVIKKRPYKTTG